MLVVILWIIKNLFIKLGTYTALDSNKGMNQLKNKGNNIMNLLSEREQLEKDLIKDAQDYYNSNQSEKDLANNYIVSAKLFIQRLEELIENNKDIKWNIKWIRKHY